MKEVYNSNPIVIVATVVAVMLIGAFGTQAVDNALETDKQGYQQARFIVSTHLELKPQLRTYMANGELSNGELRALRNEAERIELELSKQIVIMGLGDK